MLNIVMCDDEKSQLDLLKKIVSINLDLKGLSYKIFEFDCGESFLDTIPNNNYDIIFLDIEMKQLDGVTTAKIIRKNNKKSIIIFVTAYPDFVFQGYEVKALNYILKPYKSEKIAEVLNSALEQLEETQDKFYPIYLKSGVQKLNLTNTLYFTSNKRKIRAITLNDEIDFYDKLDDLEKKLPNFFIRIHQRYLININFVSAIEGYTTIINGEQLPVSRSHQQALLLSFAKTMLN